MQDSNPTTPIGPPPLPAAGEPPAARPPWGFWPTIWLGLLGMGAMVAAQAVVAIFFGIALAMQHRSRSGQPLPSGELTQQLVSDPLMLSLSVLASVPAVAFALWLMIRLRRGPGLADYLGLRGFRPAQFFLWTAALAAVVVGGDWFVQAVGDTSGATFIVDLLAKGRHLPSLIVALTIGAPLVEELLFRGFMYRGMAGPGWRLWGALVVPNVMWVLLHVQYSWPTLAVLFVMGLVFAGARHFSGSTVLPLLLHFLSNAVSMAGALTMMRENAPVP